MRTVNRRAALTGLAAMAGTVAGAMTGAVAGNLAVPSGAQAAVRPDPSSGHGIAWFQHRHGLSVTGEIDRPTARALRSASDAELLRTFQSSDDLGPEELENARIVIGVGKGAGIPEQGIVIALMAAMQESKFVNYLEPVNLDSLGIFQQRPSTGWGTPEQITHVPTSSKSFYGVAPFGSNPGLIQIDGWETMPPGEVCQAVQVSDYPAEYAKWEPFARDLFAEQGPSVDPIP